MKITTLAKNYDRWFSLSELYTSKVLKWALGAVLFGYFLTFETWLNDARLTTSAVEQGLHLCWPYFKSCGDWYFLTGLPQGYTNNLWYMGLFALMGGSAWAMMIDRWRLAHGLMWPLLLWKLWVVFFLSMVQVGNFEYYHVAFSLILLAFPHKLFFLKFSLVWFYFLSTAAKIHPAWTLGTYFSSLKTGLPIFPDATIPLWTNLVILAEMVLAWCLIRPKGVWQKLAITFFVVFHLYSGLLVGYRYPATVLPVLFILCGPWYVYSHIPKGWSTLPGWLLMGLLACGQSVSHFIPGDEKLTLEGNFYGLYMFEANHQCVERSTVYRADTEPVVEVKESFQARNRCDPYRVWFKYNQQCKLDSNIERIEVQFDHSINGAPFYRIIDVPNICAVDYKAFSHNDWILKPSTDAQKIGYPMRNYYY